MLFDKFLFDYSWAYPAEHFLSCAQIKIEDNSVSVTDEDNVYIDNFKTEGFATLRLKVQKTSDGIEVFGPLWWNAEDFEFTNALSAPWQPFNDSIFYSPEGWRVTIKATDSAFFRMRGPLP